MERIIINSGQNRFNLIDQVTEVGPENIEGVIRFSKAPIYLGMESLAQLGALHVRYMVEFKRHAFLLKMRRFSLRSRNVENSEGMPSGNVLDGSYLISGKMLSHSEMAFLYVLNAKFDGVESMNGEFLFATVDYDSDFKKDVLESHYKEVLSCLQNASKTDY